MNRFAGFAALLALSAAMTPAVAASRAERAQRWWNDIGVIAADDMEGRLTGSPGYLRAAAYVESRLKAIGLAPAGEGGGYRQTVRFQQQTIDAAGSTAALIGTDGSTTPLKVGEDILVSAGGAPRPPSTDAPLVFIGYGLHLPEQGHDDFAGVDLKGKIAVVISGGPANLPGPVKASNRSQRAAFLREAGAVGMISLTTPRQTEIPWARLTLLSSQSGMYLDDPALRETPDGLYAASLNPALADRLFAGSGHGFAELAALADSSAPVPSFDLKVRLKATVAARYETLESPNLVAKLEGSDSVLRNEYVALSAHLDHLGVGAPIAGDPVYNGAMDDGSGVAALLDMAEVLRAGARPKRSLLFVFVTAEEKGLLGSHHFARRPTVPAGAVVADLNLDMPLPLWPLTSVLVQGEAESSLGVAARTVAARQGLRLVPDPLPDRNSFVRTDQYSFVKAGIPALAFKFGFEPGTEAFRIEHDWRANRYHSPSDDLAQPGVLKEEMIKLDDYVAAIALEVANDPKRPEWNPTSVFRRFAEPK